MAKWMKRFWIEMVLAAFLMACGAIYPPPASGADITAHLTMVYSSGTTIDSNGNWPACSATVTTLCITGFNIYDLTGGARKLLFKMSNPTTTSGQQIVTSTQTVSGFSYGTHPLVATAAIIDVSSTAGEGPDSASTNCVYSPGSAPTVIFNSASAK